MYHRLLLAALLAAGLARPGYGQAVRTQPYNAQLRSDPAVGNIQGIQRYGRPLKTDPDEGEGFSYHVYPVGEQPPGLLLGVEASQAWARGAGTALPDGFRAAPAPPREQSLVETMDARIKTLTQELADARRALEAARKAHKDDATIKRLEAVVATRQKDLKDLVKSHRQLREKFDAARHSLQLHGVPELPGVVPPAALPAPVLTVAPAAVPAAVPVAPLLAPESPYPPPFVATHKMRLPPPPPPVVTAGPPAPGVPVEVPPPASYHQPLIQVKVRVIEVDRADQLLVSSVLDIIRQPFAVNPNTLIVGNNVNRDRRNLSAGTRFALPDDLITFPVNQTMVGLSALTGSGALVNLTEGNLNFIARLLASEFQSDVITAPEVVTLNGQNVEFVSGQKVPFELGQNVIQGNNNNIQQFFYKHVGTYISVTPRIVNWGPLAGGGGKARLLDTDVPDWAAFVRALLDAQEGGKVKLLTSGLTYTLARLVEGAPPDFLVPIDYRERILEELKRYPREDLVRLGLPVVEKSDHGCPPGCGPAGCDWHASDCTIDLEVIVRLSDMGKVTLSVAPAGSAPQSVDVNSEANVRALADIVQVQSGHGVVMGGLIGERDVKMVNKVPVLGDLPVVGALFRSKVTNRQKTEVLVFIEARVLDPCPAVARAESAEDFRLGHAYVDGALLDNPLEFAMYRAGFGPYLPPHSPEEKVFWERLGRKVRRIVTTVDDIFE